MTHVGINIGALIGLIIVVLVFSQIFSKAGFPGWWSIGMVIPLVNLILILYLAFAEWPVHQELERLKRTSGEVRE